MYLSRSYFFLCGMIVANYYSYNKSVYRIRFYNVCQEQIRSCLEFDLNLSPELVHCLCQLQVNTRNGLAHSLWRQKSLPKAVLFLRCQQIDCSFLEGRKEIRGVQNKFPISPNNCWGAVSKYFDHESVWYEHLYLKCIRFHQVILYFIHSISFTVYKISQF